MSADKERQAVAWRLSLLTLVVVSHSNCSHPFAYLKPSIHNQKLRIETQAGNKDTQLKALQSYSPDYHGHAGAPALVPFATVFWQKKTRAAALSAAAYPIQRAPV